MEPAESVLETVTVISEPDEVGEVHSINSLSRLIIESKRLTVNQTSLPTEDTSNTPNLPTVEAYILNYLNQSGFHSALAALQSELSARGILPKDATSSEPASVPSAYFQLQLAAQRYSQLQEELFRLRDAAEAVRRVNDRLKRERDFHRAGHSRVVQERNKLISDLRRIKAHYEQYEPTLTELKHKYDSVIKEKFLLKLDRDKLVAKLAQIQAVQGDHPLSEAPHPIVATAPGVQSGSRTLAAWPRVKEGREQTGLPEAGKFGSSGLRCQRQTGVGGISGGLCVHPKGGLLGVGLSTGSWKLLGLPSLSEVLEGRGHGDFVSRVAIDKTSGTVGATSSGSKDGSVRIWDLSKEGESRYIFEAAHSGYGVLSVDFHSLSSNWLVTGSIDQTAKILDIQGGKARQTLRGHVDAVNMAIFQPLTNTIATVSADKTASLWDMRSGLCIQTFYGHRNALVGASFAANGALLATSDLSGVVKIWDLRMCAEMGRLETAGNAAANAVAFDPSGTLLAVAGGDGKVRVCDVKGAVLTTGEGHEGEVSDVAWASRNSVVSASNTDGTVRIWQ